MVKSTISVSLVASLTAAGAYAQDAANPVVGSAINHSSNISQVFLGLIAMVALIFGLAWVIKRMGYAGGYGSAQVMKVKSCLPLSGREKLLLVQVGEEQLVLGVSPGNINLIKALDKPIETLPDSEKVVGSFSEKLVKEILSNKFSKSNE